LKSKIRNIKYLSVSIVSACGLVFGSSVLGLSQSSASAPVRTSIDPDYWMVKCTDFYIVEQSDIAVVVSDGSIYFNSFWLNGRAIVKVVDWPGGSMSKKVPDNILAPGAPAPNAFPEVTPGCLTEGTKSWQQWKKDKALWESSKIDSQRD
jgi:hypothetical protein